MKRLLFFLTVIFFFTTIGTGISNALTQPGKPAASHIVSAAVFIVLVLVHIVINIKSVVKYIKGQKVELPA